MIKKYLSFALCCLLLITANSSLISAQTNTDKTATSEAKVKAAVLKRGTGEKKRVTVKMLNGTKLKGYISQSGEDDFTLIDSKTKQSSTIAYRDVTKVENRLTRGDKIALGVVIGAAATTTVVLLSFLRVYCNNEGC